MKLHRALPIGLVLALAACNMSGSVTDPEMDSSASSEAAMEVSSASDSMMESSDAMEVSSDAMEESSDASAAMSDDDTAMEPRVIEMTVDNWSFSPNSITIKKGEKVTLRVVGSEGIHGLAIPSLGVNVSVNPGETVDVELDTDTVGTHNFFCSIPCGEGHKDMTGAIIIEA